MSMIPTTVTIHQLSKQVSLTYATPEQQTFTLSCEYLRVFSPSAEVRQHGQPILQFGKKGVGITDASLVGRYGVKFLFDDGHNTGIYSWAYLHTLCSEQAHKWDAYLEALQASGQFREPSTQAVKFTP